MNFAVNCGRRIVLAEGSGRFSGTVPDRGQFLFGSFPFSVCENFAEFLFGRKKFHFPDPRDGGVSEKYGKQEEFRCGVHFLGTEFSDGCEGNRERFRCRIPIKAC